MVDSVVSDVVAVTSEDVEVVVADVVCDVLE